MGWLDLGIYTAPLLVHLILFVVRFRSQLDRLDSERYYDYLASRANTALALAGLSLAVLSIQGTLGSTAVPRVYVPTGVSVVCFLTVFIVLRFSQWQAIESVSDALMINGGWNLILATQAFFGTFGEVFVLQIVGWGAIVVAVVVLAADAVYRADLMGGNHEH